MNRGDIKLAYDRAIAHDVPDVADRLLEMADRIEALKAENAALLAVAKSARDYIEQAISDRVRSFGENYRPSTLAAMRKELAECDAAIDAAMGESK